MKIGVLADSHDVLPDRVAELFSDVDEIWHLGDVCSPQVLTLLEDKRLFVVRGNCDSMPSWPLTAVLEREGVRFYLVHIPPYEIPEDVNVVLHGHTHVPRDEVVNGVRFLNPGSVSRPKEKSAASVGFLEVVQGKVVHWKRVQI